MKLGRMKYGLMILFASSLISFAISELTGISAIGTVAISSIVAFIGGCVFMSGVPRVV